ncbi:MAG: heparan-alpha-glucosaminide N-acetyltransferase domain-containing protein [Vicinamibacterales bacterium]
MIRRLASVDALRGGVMIVMALDHVRDFIHRGAMSQSPTDLTTTTVALFLTRWVTHFCAPVFMLTAGLGAYFYLRNGERSKGQLARFLVTRGLWLMFLELILMQLAYNFDLSSSYPIFLLVLWVLGACMIVLAGLIWLPITWLTALSIATIVLHHLLDGVRAQSFGSLGPIWTLLHQVGAFPFAGRILIAPYTLIPWFAVMALGYCFGPIFAKPADERQRLLMRAGILITIAFLLVRGLNVYGDPARWSWQSSATFTVLSFLNTTKYPPSLSFLLMTLGPALLVLSYLDRVNFSRSNPLIVFGRVPLFYFVVHFFAAHAAIVVLALITYGTSAMGFMFQPVPSMGGPAKSFPPGFGYDLWVAYVVWIAIVVASYPLCAWFARVKERNRSWWLSYL